MKSLVRLIGLSLIILSAIFHSCKKEEKPTLTTSDIINITGTSATSGGNITSEGSGTVIARGICWSTSITPTLADSKTTDGAGAGTFVSNMPDLNGAITYYVRAYATNKVGTAYGMAMSFTTLGQKPSAITQSATYVTTTTATLNGTTNANYLSTVVNFEYGSTTNYGSTITATQSPITGNSVTNVSVNINGLIAGIIYHFRVNATNSLGTSNGNDMTFVYTIADVDGNVYNTVTIGTQVWMKENLKTTKYRNGNLIGTTTPATLDINSESTPKYQWAYDGNESNVATYGRLYTWYAVTDTRNVCPTGWHVPTDAEWTVLTTFLGGDNVAGGILKEIGTTHWATPNTGATNETGFTALPSGYRYDNSTFNKIGYFGNWWRSSQYATGNAWDLGMGYDGSAVGRSGHGMHDGFSVRCLKD